MRKKSGLSGWFRWSLFCGMLIFLFSGGCAVRAQKTQKENIGKALLEANQRIERCLEEDEPCGLYLNQIRTNADQAPWGVVGRYESTKDLWYQLDEDEPEGEDVFELLKVNVKTRRSSRLEQEELLYNPDGELIFYSFKMTEGGELLQQFSFSFAEEELVDYREELAEGEDAYREWGRGDVEKVLALGEKFKVLLEGTL